VPPRGGNPEDIELHTLMRWDIRNVGVEEGVIQSHVRKQAAVIASTLHAAFQFSESRSSSSSKTKWERGTFPRDDARSAGFFLGCENLSSKLSQPTSGR
jgi:hypothetical protein